MAGNHGNLHLIDNILHVHQCSDEYHGSYSSPDAEDVADPGVGKEVPGLRCGAAEARKLEYDYPLIPRPRKEQQPT